MDYIELRKKINEYEKNKSRIQKAYSKETKEELREEKKKFLNELKKEHLLENQEDVNILIRHVENMANYNKNESLLKLLKLIKEEEEDQ